MNIRTILFGAIASLVVVGAVAGCQSEPEPIKIGAIVPLSGELRNPGELGRDGIILAVEDINKRGGLAGRVIELIIEDSKSDPEEARQAFTRLEKEHQPLFYISIFIEISDAVSELAQDNEVVLLAVVTGLEGGAGGEWVFQYPSLSAFTQSTKSPLATLLGELNVSSLGLIYVNDLFGESQLELVEEVFDGNVRAIAIEQNEFIFGRQIQELLDTDALYFAILPSQAGAILPQLKQAGYQGKIISSFAAALPHIYTLPSAEGIYMLAPIIYSPDFLFVREFKSSFESRFNKPFNAAAAITYDAIKIFADLMEDEDITRASVRRVLDQGFTYFGVFGEVNSSPGARDVAFRLYPAQVVDGKLKYLK